MGKIIGFEDLTLELPALRNNDQRKDFLREYHNWEIWFEVPETEETYYRINLPDGSSIVICEYKTYVEWKENPESIRTEMYLLKQGCHHFHDCKTNESALVEHLKNVQKKGR